MSFSNQIEKTNGSLYISSSSETKSILKETLNCLENSDEEDQLFSFEFLRRLKETTALRSNSKLDKTKNFKFNNSYSENKSANSENIKSKTSFRNIVSPTSQNTFFPIPRRRPFESNQTSSSSVKKNHFECKAYHEELNEVKNLSFS